MCVLLIGFFGGDQCLHANAVFGDTFFNQEFGSGALHQVMVELHGSFAGCQMIGTAVTGRAPAESVDVPLGFDSLFLIVGSEDSQKILSIPESILVGRLIPKPEEAKAGSKLSQGRARALNHFLPNDRNLNQEPVLQPHHRDYRLHDL